MTPRDYLGIKKLFLFIFLLYNLGLLIDSYRKNRFLFSETILIPAVLYLISVILVGKVFEPLTYLYSYLYFGLIFVLLKYHIDIWGIIRRTVNIMAGIIVISALLDFFSFIPIEENLLLVWLKEHGEAQISASHAAIAYYVLFFKASPLLLYNLVYYLKNRRYMMSIFVFSALLFSGTRANIGMGIFMIVGNFLFVERRRVWRLFSLFLMIAMLISVSEYAVNKINVINTAKSDGDSVRIETVKSIKDVMKSSPDYFITGMGYGSVYYSTGREELVDSSEMSYFELYRQTGLFFGTVILLFTLYPLAVLRRSDRALFLFYMGYLTEGFFEPFIYTSTGLFVVSCIYLEVYKQKRREQKVIKRCVEKQDILSFP